MRTLSDRYTFVMRSHDGIYLINLCSNYCKRVV